MDDEVYETLGLLIGALHMALSDLIKDINKGCITKQSQEEANYAMDMYDKFIGALED